MKCSIARCFAAWILLTASPASLFAQDSNQARDKGELLSAVVNQHHENMKFNGVVFAAKKDKVIASIAIGTSADEGKSPLNSKTLFETGSATKPFTALAILQLFERGKLTLDDPIDEHLPGVPNHSKSITIRHLLEHTSRIPGDNYGEVTANMEAVVKSMLGEGPKGKPGTKREYWNQGFALLSEIIARKSGMSYMEYCKQHIFVPAGMKSTCFTGDSPPPGVGVAVSPPTKFGPSRSALDHPYLDSYGMQYRGMGGIVSNVEDLWRWSQALVGGKLIKPETFRLMTTEKSGFSIGWRIRNNEGGEMSLGHNGTVRGFFTELRIYPKSETFLFLLANNNDAKPNFDLIKQCEEVIEGRKISTIFPLELQQVPRLVGTYRDGDSVMTVFPPVNNSPFIRATIEWYGRTTNGFLAKNIDGKICFGDGLTFEPLVFTFDKDGQAVSCQNGGMLFKK